MKKRYSIILTLLVLFAMLLAGCAGSKETEKATETAAETEAVTEARNETEPAETEPAETEKNEARNQKLYRVTIEQMYEVMMQDPSASDVVLDGNTLTFTIMGETKCTMVEEWLSDDVVKMTVTEGDHTDVTIYDYANNTIEMNGEDITQPDMNGGEDDRPFTAYMDDPVWGDKLTEYEKHATMIVTDMSTEPVYATVILEAGELPDLCIARNSETYDIMLYKDGAALLTIPVYRYNEETRLYDTITWDEEKGEAIALSVPYADVMANGTYIVQRPGTFLKYDTSYIDPEGYGIDRLGITMYQYDVRTKEIVGKRAYGVAYEAVIKEGVSGDDPDFKPEGKVFITVTDIYNFTPDPEATYNVVGTCVTSATDGAYVMLQTQFMDDTE
ncbi:MAG: hypothetical protein IJL97_02010 [Lachnospiraceae bacterium]|nr:hypothetical protein [Lachnospiraceae bacterium]